MNKRFLKVSLICLLILNMLLPLTFGANLKTSIEVVKAGDERQLENNQGIFSKKIIEYDDEKGEITVDMEITNKKESQGDKKIYDNTEIYILVDENLSRKSTKLNENVKYIENLATNIFKKNSNTKIGLIGLVGTIEDGTLGEDGKVTWGPNDQGGIEGKESNYEILSEPTNDVNKLTAAIKNMNKEKKKYRINLQAAIRFANKSYANDVNKILISFYDDVPSIAIGVCSQVSYGLIHEYATLEEAVKGKHEKISKYTKNEILKLKERNIDFIQLRPKDTSYDETWFDKDGNKSLEFDGSPYVKSLYGTLENPVYGKMYSLDKANLEQIITKYVYEDLLKVIQSDIKGIKLLDNFSKEIVENFDIIPYGKMNLEEGSEIKSNIDLRNGKVEWNVENLKGNKKAEIGYTLILKENANKEIFNKIITVNKDTVLKYIDSENKEHELKGIESPQFKINTIEEKPGDIVIPSNPVIPDKPIEENTKPNNRPTISENTIKNEKDPTIAGGKIPQTGSKETIVYTIAALSILSLIVYIKCKKYKDIK